LTDTFLYSQEFYRHYSRNARYNRITSTENQNFLVCSISVVFCIRFASKNCFGFYPQTTFIKYLFLLVTLFLFFAATDYICLEVFEISKELMLNFLLRVRSGLRHHVGFERKRF